MLRFSALLLVAVGAAGGCLSAASQSNPPPNLRGVWIVSVRKNATVASGELALLSSSSWVKHADLLSVVGYQTYGIYDLDLSPFGFDIRSRSRVPLAGARVFAADSVEVEFNPQLDHGGIILLGTLGSADSASGVWSEKRSGGMKGAFVMRKSQP